MSTVGQKECSMSNCDLSVEVGLLWDKLLQEHVNQPVEQISEPQITYMSPDVAALHIPVEQEKIVSMQEEIIPISNHDSVKEKEHVTNEEYQEEINRPSKLLDRNCSSENYHFSSFDDELKEELYRAARQLKSMLAKDSRLEVELTGTQKDNGNGNESGILVIGKNAVEILELSLKYVSEEDKDAPTVIRVDGGLMSSLHGPGLQAYISANILDANKATGAAFILVLENFKEKQILDLYGKDFIRKSLRAQSRLLNIVFLCSFLESLEYFSSIGTKLILSDFQRGPDVDQVPSSGSSDSGTETGKVSDTDDYDYTTCGTIRVGENETQIHDTMVIEEKVTLIPIPIKPARLSTSYYKKPVILTQPQPDTKKDFQDTKKGARHPDEVPLETVKDFSGSSQEHKHGNHWKFPEEESEKPEKRNICMRCLFGIVHSIFEAIAQCGDCCFY